MKFQYKAIDYEVNVGWLGNHVLNDLEKLLDKEGDSGWEAVGFTYRTNLKKAFYTVLLKKEK